MRVFVTGVAGCIGSHVADRLVAQGHTVVGIDNLLTGRAENWQGFTHGDVTEPLTDFGPHDLIVHCAASYSDRDKWHRDTDTNVAGAINVAIAAREWGCPVVYFQTALCYGNRPYGEHTVSLGRNETTITVAEDFRVPLGVRTPLNPESSYAISKVAAEQYLRLSGVPLLTFRLANIYGPRNLSGPIPAFYKRLLDGQRCTIVETRRDFIYISDLVDLVCQAIGEGATGTYHVSTGRDVPIGQVYEAVLAAMDAYGAPEPDQVSAGVDDAASILLDPTETQRAFSWVATTDLDEGVEKAVEWYREHGVETAYTHLAVNQ